MTHPATAPMFAWQRALIGTQELPEATRLTALRIGLDSAGVTGTDVVVNAGDVAGDLGCSERTVWRRVQALVDGGWLRQTARPTYGGADGRGRRARYQLATPDGRTTPDPEPGVVCHPPAPSGTRQTGSSDTAPRPAAHDKAKSSAKPPPTVADENGSHLPNQAQSCATTTRDDGTLFPSCGSNNCCSSSARPPDRPAAAISTPPLPAAVEIFRRKTAAHTALAPLRWDKLDIDKLDRIAALVDQHGDQRLIDVALATLRRDQPPVLIQAFLGTWEALPPPGQHLALVKPGRCDEHGVTLSSSGICSSCEAERKAGHR